MARKLRSGGSTSDNSLDRTKKYKYNTAGTLTEFDGEPGDIDIVFSGSKSNLRRIADLERNVSIIANKILTTDGNATDADDASFNNKFADAVRFKDNIRVDGTTQMNDNVDILGQVVISDQTTIGGGYGSTGITMSASGALSMDGNLTVEGSGSFGGGYGSSGVGITAEGEIQADGRITSDTGFTGDVTGDVTGDLTGNVTGNIDGIVGGNTPAAGTFTTIGTSGDVTVGGNLTVSGTTTTVNSNTVNIGDSVLTLNSDETGAPSQNGGFEIERGTSDNVSFVWNEANDQWTTNGQPLRSGHMLPETDVTYDLGSSSLKWRDLYLSGSTIRLGNATISDSGGAISSSGGFSGNASTASAWQTARTLSLTGAVTGSASIDGSGNVSLATTNTADPTLTLAGDASGSATFTNLGNATLTVTVANDSHSHSNYITSNANDEATGIYTFSNTTAATSATTGAVKITGGLGVGGAIYASGDVTAYSDDRLKTNVHEIENGLDKVMALRGITFERIADGSISTGVSAQDVHAVLPEAVSIDEEGLMAVKYGNLVGLLIEAIKDLKDEVNELKGTGTVH